MKQVKSNKHNVLRRSEEIIDDLALLDGKGEEVNLLQSLDLGIFYEATEFSDGNPLFLLFFASTTASAPTTTSATASTAPREGKGKERGGREDKVRKMCGEPERKRGAREKTGSQKRMSRNKREQG